MSVRTDVTYPRTIRLVTVLILDLLTACSTTSPSSDCTEDLHKSQDRAAFQAIEELDGIGDTLEGALDVQKQGQVNERSVAQALGRIRNLGDDLASDFSLGCE